MRRFFMFLAGFAVLSFTAWAAAPTFSPEEISEDTQWLQALGFRLPDTGYLLESPWSAPLSRQSFATPIRWMRQPLPTEIQASALRADLPFIRTALEKTYSGYEVARDRGWDWDAWLKRWDDVLASAGDQLISVETAFAPVRELKRFQPDNHMYPRIVSADSLGASGSRSALLKRKPSGDCSRLRSSAGDTLALDPQVPSHRPKAARITDADTGYYISYPGNFGTAVAIECGAEWVELEDFWQNSATPEQRVAKVLRLSETQADGASFRVIDSDILYIRFPRTNYEHRESYLELEKRIKAMDLSQFKVMILDHRGNAGGYSFANTIYDRISQGAFSRAKSYSRTAKRSCLTEGAGIWGQIQWMLRNTTSRLPDEDLASYQEILDGMMKPVESECPVALKESPGGWIYQDRFYKPDLTSPVFLVLVDLRCASTCEGSLFRWSQNPNALIAGANTLGVGQFTGGSNFVLPNSKVIFQFSSGVSNFYGDNRPFDNYGLDVDWVLASEASQESDFILKLARSLR